MSVDRLIRNDRLRGGFTLLEVLLALVLFSLSVTVLVAAYLNTIEGLEGVKINRTFEQEVRWVREQVLLQSDLNEVEQGGEGTSPAGVRVRWNVAVSPTTIADLFMIDLRVEMERERGDPLVQEDRLSVLRPSWSEPVARGDLIEEAKQRIEADRVARGVVSSKRT